MYTYSSEQFLDKFYKILLNVKYIFIVTSLLKGLNSVYYTNCFISVSFYLDFFIYPYETYTIQVKFEQGTRFRRG